jgi:ABC-type proline/glycine betaine transport system ATPase subunit
MIYVTHDQVEAMTIGDRICVMPDGLIMQVADPLTLLNLPWFELITWATNEATLRGRAHYGRIDEVAEYVFQFIRTSEGELLKFGTVAFSKSEDRALARQVIDIFGTKNW